MHSEEEEQKHLGEIEVQLSYHLVGLQFHLGGLDLSRRWFTPCDFSQVHIGSFEVQLGYRLAGPQNYISGLEPESVPNNIGLQGMTTPICY